MNPERWLNLSEEAVMHEDPETGAKKNLKRCRIDLIDPEFRWLLGEVMGDGGVKYGENNYQLHTKAMLPKYYAAMERHIARAQLGEEFDKESGSSHMAHIAANAQMIWFIAKYGDDE